ncbi:molybdopterin-synthase adenylyltransferase MoeB [Flavobacterium ranwuense]|uniref:Molybdopterin-synthase adenylyltransferase MoeB n=1 Tax=Flavobacterium ranwuense TaxID=2541725 RepID=A0ABY2DRK0_9FLAO|nr:molybdopterin-synthase adenylyltransferase MoeB [Flavobacterium ranwuense]TDE29413.1 molybdopterin-synthase adenylyltransferase MoeB [Flavobacterium ranwuense]
MIDLNSYLNVVNKKVIEKNVDEAFNNQISKNALIIDIREPDEINSGSPTNAIRISKGMLEMQIGQIVSNPEIELFIMCAAGKRSLIASYSLIQMGYKNVFSVKGGFNAWKNKSLPFEIPKKLNSEDFERYKRNILVPEVGEKGQLKLLNSKILIVGAGGIGSPVALYLAATGIGTLGIIDDDIVDKTNLQRQILHSEKSVGKSKVMSAKKRISELNSQINVIEYNKRITKENIEIIISNYDIVIDGTDNFNTRYLINDACVKLKIPNIHGSVFLFEGQFTTFWPSSKVEDAPCYRCLYPLPPPPEIAPSCAEAGVLGVLPGLIGVLCATEAIKIILGLENMVGKLMVYNALSMDFETYKVENNKNCEYCGCQGTEKYPEYSDYSESCTI